MKCGAKGLRGVSVAMLKRYTTRFNENVLLMGRASFRLKKGSLLEEVEEVIHYLLRCRQIWDIRLSLARSFLHIRKENARS